MGAEIIVNHSPDLCPLFANKPYQLFDGKVRLADITVPTLANSVVP